MSLHPYMTFSVVNWEIHGMRSRHTDLGMRMMERPAGIGPASRAWEARVLPLYDGRAVVPYKPWALADPGGEFYRSGFRDEHE